MIYILFSVFIVLYIAKFFKWNNKKDDKILIDNLSDREEVINDEIDVIITWVDSSDSKWIELKEYYKNNSFKLCDSSDKRFPNKIFSSTELYFCVSSISKYMPWVRNIFILTGFNQKPEWVDQFPNVKIIDHTKVIPNEYLPTFNSRAIECFLHRIPNLSEKFIYFNDDFYVVKYLKKNFFFKNNFPITTGKLRELPFYYRSNFLRNILKKFYSNFTLFRQEKKVIILGNILNYELLDKNKVVSPSHVALPLTKEIMKYINKEFRNNVEITCRSKFRSVDSLRVTYLAANITKYISKYGGDKKVMSMIGIKNLNQAKDQKLICINDVHENSSFKKLIDFFDKNHGIKHYNKKE